MKFKLLALVTLCFITAFAPVKITWTAIGVILKAWLHLSSQAAGIVTLFGGHIAKPSK